MLATTGSEWGVLMIDWDGFDAETYVHQNYGRGILPEDVQIMRFVVANLRDLQISPESLRVTADIGAGPNLYPGLLLAPYIARDGVLELIDRSAANLRYLRDLLEGADGGSQALWSEFECRLLRLGHRTSM